MASLASSQIPSLDVLFLTQPDDEHCRLVDSLLVGRNRATFDLSQLTEVRFDVSERVVLWLPNGPAQITDETTVWWRRPGSPVVVDLDDEEAQLVIDEAPHILKGTLEWAGVRWLDRPDLIMRAELKLRQLAVARSLGVATPPTVLTSSPETAAAFASSHQAVVKALSPGVGIAPYTSPVGVSDSGHVKRCPSLLQAQIPASADVRVVVVGGRVWTWRRVRGDEVDWRAADPAGRGFRRMQPETALVDQALSITAALGLSTSVQDWLETKDGPVFLEVNPQGNWLFLVGSEDTVGPALADLVAGVPEPSDGAWPGPWRRLANDFRSQKNALPRDGIKSPVWLPPSSLRGAAAWDGSLDVARRSHDEAARAASVAEEKASRLLRTSLALLAIALAAVPLQMAAGSTLFNLALVAIPIAAVAFLSIAAFRSTQIDRVGIYWAPRLSDLDGRSSEPLLAILEQEERGRYLARWTAEHKLTELLQAQAWFTRGLMALIVAGVVIALTLIISGS